MIKERYKKLMLTIPVYSRPWWVAVASEGTISDEREIVKLGKGSDKCTMDWLNSRIMYLNVNPESVDSQYLMVAVGPNGEELFFFIKELNGEAVLEFSVTESISNKMSIASSIFQRLDPD